MMRSKVKQVTRCHSLLLSSLLLISGHVLGQDRERDAWQKPEAIMDSLGIKPEIIIGEAGAGDGYFTFHLAGRVGPKGRVYANDIDDEALEKLQARMKKEEVGNIETIPAEANDPMFPPGKLDMVVMMNVFHHIEKTEEWMKNVIPGMKPGALMAFIETEPDKRPSRRGHFLTKQEILKRMKKTRFRFVRTFDFLERDTVYLFSLDSAQQTHIIRTS